MWSVTPNRSLSTHGSVFCVGCDWPISRVRLGQDTLIHGLMDLWWVRTGWLECWLFCAPTHLVYPPATQRRKRRGEGRGWAVRVVWGVSWPPSSLDHALPIPWESETGRGRVSGDHWVETTATDLPATPSKHVERYGSQALLSPQPQVWGRSRLQEGG